MEETAAALVAQICRLLARPGAAPDMMLDVRAAFDGANWDGALYALQCTQSPQTFDTARYPGAAEAMDSAANDAWKAVRPLFAPDIDLQAEAIADEAMEEDGTAPAKYLSTLRYWEVRCPGTLPCPLEQLITWGQIRDTAKHLITQVVLRFFIDAVLATIVKDQLSDDHYRALTWPFSDAATDHAAGATSEDQ